MEEENVEEECEHCVYCKYEKMEDKTLLQKKFSIIQGIFSQDKERGVKALEKLFKECLKTYGLHSPASFVFFGHYLDKLLLVDNKDKIKKAHRILELIKKSVEKNKDKEHPDAYEYKIMVLEDFHKMFLRVKIDA